MAGVTADHDQYVLVMSPDEMRRRVIAGMVELYEDETCRDGDPDHEIWYLVRPGQHTLEDAAGALIAESDPAIAVLDLGDGQDDVWWFLELLIASTNEGEALRRHAYVLWVWVPLEEAHKSVQMLYEHPRVIALLGKDDWWLEAFHEGLAAAWHVLNDELQQPEQPGAPV